MKKIALLVMILLLCLPAVSRAADEKQYIGTWIQEKYDEETGRYSVELLHLTADHQAYYTVQVFCPGEVGIGRQAAKTWWVTGNGIHIVLGENAETDAIILDDGRLGFKLAGSAVSPFTRVPSETGSHTLPSLSDLKTGVTIPQGEYFVGTDIPAGRYIAEAGTSRKITLWIYDARGWSNYYYLGTYNNESMMVMTLEDGGKLRVEDSSVIIREYTGLFQ